MSIPVLTVTGPWAWALIHAGKDVENRVWYTKHRGPLAIHMGKCKSKSDREDIRMEVAAILGWDTNPAPRDLSTIDLSRVPDTTDMESTIIGIVDLWDCTRDTVGSIWEDIGQFHWRCRTPRPVQPVRIRGALGLWHYPGQLAEVAPEQPHPWTTIACPRCQRQHLATEACPI